MYSDWTLLEVGKSYPMLLKSLDGHSCQFDVNGITLSTFYANPSPDEIENFTMKNGYVVGLSKIEEILFFTLKCGTLEWMDIPFHPLLQIEHKIPIPKIENMTDTRTTIPMNVLLIDRLSGEIKSMRSIGIGYDLSIYFWKECNQQQQHNLNIPEYSRKVNNIYKNYNSSEIFEKTEATYYMLTNLI